MSSNHPAPAPQDPVFTPLRLGTHVVPGLWRYLLPKSLVDLPLPEERRATCSNCPRVTASNFRPDYRCCTYYPRIPNFLLGLALLEGKTAAKVVAQSASRSFLMPEGFQASPAQWADLLTDVGEGLYGQSSRVLCPYLQKATGYCGIYAFRNSVCSTFFCYHDHGTRGDAFWEALQTTVVQVEMVLGQWALRQVGFSVDDYVKRMNALAPKIEKTSDPKSRTWNEMARRAAWGEHYGKELDVYRACAEKILAHKDELWTLANENDIVEADLFEIAAQSVVPEAHRGEIEDDYSDPERETIRPRELWNGSIRRLRNLHKLPEGQLVLSPRVRLIGGTVEYLEKRSSNVSWRQDVGEGEERALTLFTQPNRPEKLLPSIAALTGRDGARFVAEWFGREVLIKAR